MKNISLWGILIFLEAFNIILFENALEEIENVEN